MKEILSTSWSKEFFLVSLLARTPLYTVPVIILLGTLGRGESAASAGALIACLTAGAALTGIFQGPLWDRFYNAGLYLTLSLLAAGLLVLLAWINTGPLALLIAAGYGLARPYTSTVVRSVWIRRLSPSPLASQSMALDVAAMSVLGIAGPLLATVAFDLLGFTGSLLFVAMATVLFSAFFSWLIKEYHPLASKVSHYWGTLRGVMTKSHLSILLLVALMAATALGAVDILLGIDLRFDDKLSWFGPLLAVYALGVVIGSNMYKRIAHNPKKYFHWLLLLKGFSLLILAAAFMLPPETLWPVIFLSAFMVAPISAILYTLVDSSVEEGSRGAAFSLLASAQFTGAALGQYIFAVVADQLGVSGAMVVAAALQISCWGIWIINKKNQASSA